MTQMTLDTTQGHSCCIYVLLVPRDNNFSYSSSQMHRTTHYAFPHYKVKGVHRCLTRVTESHIAVRFALQ